MADHFFDESRPVVGEVLSSYYGNGVAQLLLECLGGFEHQTDDVGLYELSIDVRYCAGFIDNPPVSFDKVFKNNRGCLTSVSIDRLIVCYLEEDHGVVLCRLNRDEKILCLFP